MQQHLSLLSRESQLLSKRVKSTAKCQLVTAEPLISEHCAVPLPASGGRQATTANKRVCVWEGGSVWLMPHVSEMKAVCEREQRSISQESCSTKFPCQHLPTVMRYVDEQNE